MNAETPEQGRTLSGESLLGETADRLLTARCDPETVRQAEAIGWDDTLWGEVAGAGFPWIGLSGDGSGGTLLDTAEILHRCGRYGVPLPVAETGMIGGWMLQRAGVGLPDGPVTVPVPHPDDEVELSRRDGGWHIGARFHRVPWASNAARIVFAVSNGTGAEHIVSVDVGDNVQPARNLAGEPRDTVEIGTTLSAASVTEVPPGTAQQVRRRGALSRALLIAGALERSSELATAYARERQQFGQVIARFQAVQQHLVLAAEHASAASIAAWTAAAAVMENDDDPHHKVAIARAVAHDSVNVVTARTHQVFGAIGMTKEHELHLRTRRAWAWTEEWGTGQYWAEQLGGDLLVGGADELWATLASGSVRS